MFITIHILMLGTILRAKYMKLLSASFSPVSVFVCL